MKLNRFFIPACLILLVHTGAAAQSVGKPKLVINIVISQMRYEYLERFRDNFSENGFRTYLDSGVNFTNARCNYMQTNTVAGLATLSTGTNPAGHGVASESWYNYTTNDSINLIADDKVKGLDCEEGENRFSPLNLTAATLGDRLHESDPKSKVVAVAEDPYSAVISGGSTGSAFWLDPGKGQWVSSSYYFENLPFWVKKYNEKRFGSGCPTNRSPHIRIPIRPCSISAPGRPVSRISSAAS